jgi:hypothetical protein
MKKIVFILLMLVGSVTLYSQRLCIGDICLGDKLSVTNKPDTIGGVIGVLSAFNSPTYGKVYTIMFEGASKGSETNIIYFKERIESKLDIQFHKVYNGQTYDYLWENEYYSVFITILPKSKNDITLLITDDILYNYEKK